MVFICTAQQWRLLHVCRRLCYSIPVFRLLITGFNYSLLKDISMRFHTHIHTWYTVYITVINESLIMCMYRPNQVALKPAIDYVYQRRQSALKTGCSGSGFENLGGVAGQACSVPKVHEQNSSWKCNSLFSSPQKWRILSMQTADLKLCNLRRKAPRKRNGLLAGSFTPLY